MKNYPNQASNFARVRGTLEVIRQVNEAGQNPLDDGVLGLEAARRGVYEFRGLPFAQISQEQLEQRLQEETAKPASNQGTRTFARELRRTLRNMGWIDGDCELTDAGEALLATAPASLEERALLAEGLLRIAVTDQNDHTSHPVYVLLELLSVGPSQYRRGLELALEARDDSQAEIDRVKALYKLSPDDRQQALGISEHQRNNAVKIFPTLAKTAGLVVEDGHGVFSLSPDGWSVLGMPIGQVPEAILTRAKVTYTEGKQVTTATVATKVPDKPPKFLSEDEQKKAADRLQERTVNHQKLVRDFSHLIGDDVGSLYEDPFSYDLLWVPSEAEGSPCFLFEMKTIHNDADFQARLALGQLAYYAYFRVSVKWPTHTVVRCAVFDADIGPHLATFLEKEQVGAIALTASGAIPLNELGQSLLVKLPQYQGV
ncbi:hypothetical protein A5773_12980 [Mycobacterium sp. 852014-52450_SCH5900713]|uniref:hypothetical protein n=1 Tax=Mycobacterium sp. 852014-52450_SCH5900713 TaxID=1834116 RepID=UPI0007FC044F|nr:hypothetical protein [Mycobacterium sp. 852014-52450_SCH5900713]OBF96335.1 hypothetical protein A5773_12980 [Mycobacterium sp. 852014-52450_SCH5900713]